MEQDLEESGLLPEAPTRELGEGYSTQAARGASAITQQHAAAEATGRAIIAMPNGDYGFLDEDEEWLGSNSFLAAKHQSLFADPVNLLADPKPGYKYVWAAKYTPKGDKANAQTVANIRSKRYECVTSDMLKPDLDLPIENHKIGGYECAGIVDVLLMAVTPEAQRILYKWRTFEAKRRTNRWQSYGTLNAKIQGATRGQAYAEVERKE